MDYIKDRHARLKMSLSLWNYYGNVEAGAFVRLTLSLFFFFYEIK